MRTLLWFLLGSVAFGQVPQGFTATEYTLDAPEIKAFLFWLPVPGATSYNVYEAKNTKIDISGCPVLKLDHSQTDNFYLDNPNPGWYSIPVSNGIWKGRFWCYAVTAVINGVESDPTATKSVAIGESGYLSFSMTTPGTVVPNNPCAGDHPIIPFPLTASQITIKIIYRKAGDTVEHEIPTTGLIFSPYNQPTKYSSVEVEWKIPVTAVDGTFVPWNPTDSYFARVFIPGHQYVSSWAPAQNRDLSFYNQAGNNFLPDGEQCPFWGGTYQFNGWQDVTK